jgi:hypothetical protein
MKSIIGFALIGLFFLSMLVSYFSDYHHSQADPGPLGFFPVFILWIWMVIDLIRAKNFLHRTRWGIFLLIFNWIAAIVYFVTVYYRKQNKIDFFETFKLINPRFYRYLILIMLSSIITLSHFLFFSMLYRRFGIPFPNFYNVVVSGILYAPMVFYLKLVYTLANVDLSSPPEEVWIFSHVVNFIYTFILYFLLTIAISHFRRTRARQKESITA